MISAITTWLATASSWVQSFGSFAWIFVALFATLICLAIILVYLETCFRLNKSRAIRYWVENPESVNPLDNTFTRRRISLQDLADPFTQEISGKTFTDCELNGPCILIVGARSEIRRTTFLNCDVIEVKPREMLLNNAIVLVDCYIVGGRIAQCTILASAPLLNDLRAMGAQPITD